MQHISTSAAHDALMQEMIPPSPSFLDGASITDLDGWLMFFMTECPCRAAEVVAACDGINSFQHPMSSAVTVRPRSHKKIKRAVIEHTKSVIQLRKLIQNDAAVAALKQQMRELPSTAEKSHVIDMLDLRFIDGGKSIESPKFCCKCRYILHAIADRDALVQLPHVHALLLFNDDDETSSGPMSPGTPASISSTHARVVSPALHTPGTPDMPESVAKKYAVAAASALLSPHPDEDMEEECGCEMEDVDEADVEAVRKIVGTARLEDPVGPAVFSEPNTPMHEAEHDGIKWMQTLAPPPHGVNNYAFLK